MIIHYQIHLDIDLIQHIYSFGPWRNNFIFIPYMHHWIGSVSIGKMVQYTNNNISRSRSKYFQLIHQEKVSKYALWTTIRNYSYRQLNCIQKTHWFDHYMYSYSAKGLWLLIQMLSEPLLRFIKHIYSSFLDECIENIWI